MSKILIIAAHPDDEVLGCGGTIARMVKERHEAYAVILSEGIRSRKNYTQKQVDEIFSQQILADSVLGIKKWRTFTYPDNQFDIAPLLDIVRDIEDMIEDIKPSIIFTHFKDDLNIDHRITYQAVITATRPMPGGTVKEIYSFEAPSSTEWAFPTSFSPDVFWNIDEDSMSKKLSAIQQYESEIRKWPHPRSKEGIVCMARYRGMQIGLEYAEAFKTVRVIR